MTERTARTARLRLALALAAAEEGGRAQTTGAEGTAAAGLSRDVTRGRGMKAPRATMKAGRVSETAAPAQVTAVAATSVRPADVAASPRLLGGTTKSGRGPLQLPCCSRRRSCRLLESRLPMLEMELPGEAALGLCG